MWWKAVLYPVLKKVGEAALLAAACAVVDHLLDD